MFCCIHFTFSAFILLSRLKRNVNGQWYMSEVVLIGRSAELLIRFLSLYAGEGL